MNDDPALEIIDCEQGSPEWFAARLGIPTASNFGDVLAWGRDGPSKGRDEYLRKLAGEIITSIPREDFRNAAMDRGNAMEPTLRGYYEMETGAKLHQVGFLRRTESYGVIGASPDSVFENGAGGVEFKSAAPHVLIDIMRAGRVPPEHLPQLQGNMLVRDAPHWELVIGYEGMPLFRRRVHRDTAYIARLRVALEVFQRELDELVTWVRNYGRT